MHKLWNGAEISTYELWNTAMRECGIEDS